MKKTVFFFLSLFFALVEGVASFSGESGKEGAYILSPVNYLNHPDKKASPASAAMDDAGVIYMAWIREEGERSNIYVAASSDNGKTFGEKVRVNGDADMPAGIHQAPSMAIGLKGEVYIAWSAARPEGELASDLRFARSVDRGRTFESSIKVNDDIPPSSHGFESMTVAPDGTVYIAWLDGREKKHGIFATYIARSIDSGKTFDKNVRVDGGSCPCCRTSVAAAPDGTIYAAWRKVLEGDIREIVVASSTDMGRTFSKPAVVGNDNWKIAGCPHRGPALGALANGVLYIVWYTEGGDGAPAVYIASSSDRGTTFAKKGLPYSKGSFPDHPVMAFGKDFRPLVLWEETTPVLSKVMFHTFDDNAPEQMSQGVRRAHDPSIYVNRNGNFVIAWVQEEIRFSKIALRTGLFR